MKRGQSKFMNKRDGNIDDKKIEEYLSSIPDQLKESDDFMLAQKGLEHLQENKSFESGGVLIKVKRRSIVCVGIVGLIFLLIAAIIIGITVGDKSSQTFYDETLMYPKEILSVQDYNINNGTSFLNLDDHSDIISSSYSSRRFKEDDSLAYIRVDLSITTETSYSEIRYYIKEIAQELSVFKQYELADENIAIDGIEVSFVSEIINQVIYHVDAKFIYEEVYYYLTIDSTDENCLENTVRLLLESAK